VSVINSLSITLSITSHVGEIFINFYVKCISQKDVRFYFFLNNQPDAPIIKIYSVLKLDMFRASSLPINRSILLYIRHW